MSTAKSTQDLTCVTCGSDEILPKDFRNLCSLQEFEFSRMCQRCQDDLATC